MKKGTLRYRGQTVDPKIFKIGRKDLRKLVGYCYNCGCCLRGRLAIPTSDPYQADVHGDETPVVQCESCAADAAEEI